MKHKLIKVIEPWKKRLKVNKQALRARITVISVESQNKISAVKTYGTT